MTYMAVKFNFQQVLLETLIPTMNTFKDTAVLNIIKTDGKKMSLFGQKVNNLPESFPRPGEHIPL